MQTTLKKPCVTMWREGQMCLVDATCEAILRRILQTRRYQCEQNTDGSLAVNHCRHSLYERSSSYFGDDAFSFWFGVAPAVFSGLLEEGIEVKFRGGLRLAPMSMPVPDKDLPDRHLIEFVCKNDRGIIHYNPGGVHPINFVAQLARAWPKLNITLVVFRRDDTVNLARRLRALGVKAFGFNGKGRPQVYTRVAVCTPSTIAYNPVEPEKQDIIIVLDAVKAIGDDNQWRLQRAVKARFYGILNAERSMSPHEEDLVRMMFGFDELLIPRPGHQARPVQVVWSRGNSRPIRFEPRNVLDLKRFGVWDDDERNRQVARIARAFLHGDGEALARLLKPCPPSNCGSPLNTFIVVENIEHAMKLVPKLPGWSVLSSGLTDMNGLTENEKTALEDSYSIQAKPACGIITHGGMHHHRTPWSKVDVLIRADAGTGLPDLPTLAQAQLATESPRPLVIVDLDDVHHDELMRRANDRWDAYCGNGWLLPGLDLTSFRISEFLRYHGIGRKGFKR